jgi:hypothetical protein
MKNSTANLNKTVEIKLLPKYRDGITGNYFWNSRIK